MQEMDPVPGGALSCAMVIGPVGISTALAIAARTGIVKAMGNDADETLYFALKGKVRELLRAGDCVAPRRVDMAILEGYLAGKRV